MGKVYVLGSINCDLVIGSSKLPKAGETLSGHDFFMNPGGKGANQAVASSKMGAETYMIGAIGCDIFGQACYESLEKYGCSVQFVKKILKKPTGIASIWVIEYDNRILLDAGANYGIEEEYVVSVLEKNAGKGDILVAQLEIKQEVVESAFKFAKKIGMVTLLNPAPVPAGGVSRGLLKNTDILVPNETETAAICGFSVSTQEDLRRAVADLKERGVGSVYITMGKYGSYFSDGETEKQIKIFPVRVVDTTAAGDTTIGALAYRLAYGYTAKSSMEFCAAASALTVSRSGAQQSIPFAEEVTAFLKDNGLLK